MIEFTQTLAESDIPQDCCAVCDHSYYERDPAGTGDSPSGYVCDTDKESDCPFMAQFEIDVDKLTDVIVCDVSASDAPKFMDAWIESAEYLGEQLDVGRIDFINNDHHEIVAIYAAEKLR